MDFSNEEQRVLVRALEMAIGQVSLEDSYDFRVILDKLKEQR